MEEIIDLLSKPFSDTKYSTLDHFLSTKEELRQVYTLRLRS